MARIILPNTPAFTIPVTCPPLLRNWDSGLLRAVEFGVELEGFVPLDRISSEDLRGQSKQRQYEALAAAMQQGTDVVASEKFTHRYRQGWKVKDDETIKTDFELAQVLLRKQASILSGDAANLKAEITSRVLAGNPGLDELTRVFDRLDQLEFRANKSCDLHVHVSLGWVPPIRAEELQEIKNIHTAFVRNQEFFYSLVDERQRTNPYCYPNRFMSSDDLARCTTMVDLEREYSIDGNDRRHMLNLHAIKKYGTVEYRMREADGYCDAIGYVRFLVAFTFEAAFNPYITPQQILDRYFVPGRLAEAGFSAGSDPGYRMPVTPA